MLWWNEIVLLKRQLKEVQQELEKEQGKAGRLAGFIRRLQSFSISPVGEAPRRPFAEALIDSMSTYLKADQVILFQIEPDSLDLVPTAGRGIAPNALSRLRVRPGESILGTVAQTQKAVIQNQAPAASTGGTEEGLFSAPYMIFPILSQGLCTGLLLIAKLQEGTVTSEAGEMAALFAMQAALILEDHDQHEELERLHEDIVVALTRAIEARDSGTQRHSSRTRALVRAMAQELHLPEPLICEIEYGAILHDLGKIGIDDAILRKPGKLTPDEYTLMKAHPAIGHRILQSIPNFRQVGAIVLYHQEWYNGTGYPEGLAGEEIPLGARIVQILDAWDAMTSDRTYRQAMPKSSAIAELRRQEGTQFDPRLVELFLRVIDRLEREGIPTTEDRVGTAVTADLP